MRSTIVIAILLLFCLTIQAQNSIKDPRRSPSPVENTSAYRSNCIESHSQTDININNVRARLRAGVGLPKGATVS